ncbi:MAG: 3-methyl-2-oxobutanoate hydroxymethyltransferase [Bacteriovoracaceae bacterium]
MSKVDLEKTERQKKQNIRKLRSHKLENEKRPLQMLTCYDFQTATLLNETSLDLILVGDSLGNVVLGFENTLKVTPEMMSLFGAAVKRGAPDKFVVVDLPFGSTLYSERGMEIAATLMRETGAEAVKIEGANDKILPIVETLVKNGIPVMGHIGLIPQSLHQLGGYYRHGKNEKSANNLKEEAKNLEAAGCFSIVLECVEESLSKEITDSLRIPTIGIGSGKRTDGQVLVLNDLLGLGKDKVPSFVSPIANLYETKHKLIEDYLKAQSELS